jgi:hypothetical protein
MNGLEVTARDSVSFELISRTPIVNERRKTLTIGTSKSSPTTAFTGAKSPQSFNFSTLNNLYLKKINRQSRNTLDTTTVDFSLVRRLQSNRPIELK